MTNLHTNHRLTSIPAAAGQDGQLQQDLIDYVNYHISGRSLASLTEGAEEAEPAFAPCKVIPCALTVRSAGAS